jgi:hypothetical protein
MKPVVQKTHGRINIALRESARYAPHCFGCGLANPDNNLLCLAHANGLESGKAMNFKSPCERGAILCLDCHQHVDGQKGHWTREKKREYHMNAHIKTMAWWVKIGLVK